MDKRTLLSTTADIVSAHASLHAMTQEALVSEIGMVFARLASLAGTEGVIDLVVETPVPAGEECRPAVPLDAAFGSERVFCMVCGQGMKTLKRHLSSSHGLKPGQYRRQFGIPAGTALVARSYSESRQAMAKELRLGDQLVKARAARVEKAAAEAAAPKRGPRGAKKA